MISEPNKTTNQKKVCYKRINGTLKKKKSIKKIQSNFFSLLLTGFPDLHILLVQILRSILLVFKEVVLLNQKEKSKVRAACFFL